METCYGCGIRAPKHPIAGVMAQADVEDGQALEGAVSARGFVNVAVCNACHQDPEHRTWHPLKAHFFERAVAAQALAAAGSSTLG